MISNYLKKSKLTSVLDDLNIQDKLSDSYGDTWSIRKYKNIHEPLTLDNYFSEVELENIILYANKIKRTDGKTFNETEIDYRRSEVSWLVPNDITKWLYEKMTRLIWQVNEDQYKFKLDSLQAFQFTRYTAETSGKYDKHLDVGLSSNHDRKLSMVLQLSDPEDYSGGDLMLHTYRNPNPIEKRKGRITFFPSYLLHEVTPVTSGTRMSLVCWITGPNIE